MLIFWSAAVIALSAATLTVLGLASVIFLSTLVLTVALMLRSHWNKMVDMDSDSRDPKRS